jgi:hypothetical protein
VPVPFKRHDSTLTDPHAFVNGPLERRDIRAATEMT